MLRLLIYIFLMVQPSALERLLEEKARVQSLSHRYPSQKVDSLSHQSIPELVGL